MRKLLLALLILVCLVGGTWAEEEFPIKNLIVNEYSVDVKTTDILGEITNNSGQTYKACVFRVSFYGESENLLGAADVRVPNFKEGETVTFKGFSKQDITAWKTFKVRLEHYY